MERPEPHNTNPTPNNIEWALKEIDYKYFGAYELSDNQWAAVIILEQAAIGYLEILERE
jgi:hypothetical protein